MLSNEDLKLIEDFISKDEPVMKFEEIQVVVKMQYEIYVRMMQPTFIINTHNDGGNKDD